MYIQISYLAVDDLKFKFIKDKASNRHPFSKACTQNEMKTHLLSQNENTPGNSFR